MIKILNRDEVKNLKESGKILSQALLLVKKNVAPGVSTLYLSEIADKFICERGGIPSFKGYKSYDDKIFPAALCVSINDEVVHGIPSQNKILNEGDIVSLDLGVKFKGMCSDAAITIGVGKISKEKQDLIDATKKCLQLGIEQTVSGNHIGAIGFAIQNYAESFGFGVVRDLVGHGVGENPHMEPSIPNYGKISDGPIIVDGMALAIEPMITLGDYQIKNMPDGWTIKTADGSASAHFEHTVVVENGKPVIVTN